MKLRVISDIHVEFYSSPSYIKSKLNKLFFDGKDDCEIIEDEILIIAGDLGVAGSGLSDLDASGLNPENSNSSLNPEYKSILEYFSQRWRNIILIPGNHEYYDRDKKATLDDVDRVIEKECDKLGITFLNKNYVMIPEYFTKDRYAVLGCTLWSEATKEAYCNMNDRLKAILSHTELLQTHKEHKEWLKKTLSKLHKKGIKTILVTHHLPLMELTHPKYLSEKYKHLNSAYASKLNDLFWNPRDSEHSKGTENSSNSLIPFYCCGHTHEKTEIKLYGTEFLINPLGYPREKKETTFRAQFVEI
jgi:UDP-2,3-diacylglucosamine pyrophosphatase LpxH